MVRKRNQILFGAMTLVLAVALFVTPSAHAGFVLAVDDLGVAGVEVIVVDDAAIGTGTAKGLSTHADGHGAAGVISWSGAVGPFTVSVTVGGSKPTIGPAELDLFAVVDSEGAGMLEIMLTDTGYTHASPSYTSELGGTTDGTVAFWQYRDATDAEFGMGTTISHGTFGPGAFSDTKSKVGGGAASWSFTEHAVLTHGASGGVTSFDMNSSVPLPAAVLCVLGFPLVAGRGMSRFARRAV